jgi:hypothetical protein
MVTIVVNYIEHSIISTNCKVLLIIMECITNRYNFSAKYLPVQLSGMIKWSVYRNLLSKIKVLWCKLKLNKIAYLYLYRFWNILYVLFEAYQSTH